jgi:oxygen-independent coproporphyrinogen-3 oxidase
MGTPHHSRTTGTRQTEGRGISLPVRTTEKAGSSTAAAALRRPRPPVSSLYIHTPFCFHKCHYCDFYSIVDTQDRQREFVDRLSDELGALVPHAAGEPLRTIFVGGGTPSLLAHDLWLRLLRRLDDLFDLSTIRAGGGDAGEFTVECNPESTTPELMGILRAGGVNRVSIGAQSFNPAHLKTLERWHDPDNVARAVHAARAAGIERQSIDLIFAIPGQTVREWASDLDRALALGTTHLSCYNLTYEPATAMTARLKLGEFTPVDEDTEAAMFELTAGALASRGLARYEVSNFAAPGAECRHNLAYWRQEQWLAAGPSASGHVWAGEDRAPGGWRWKNVPRLADYLASEGLPPVVDLEEPQPRRALRERLMTGLRLAEGLDAASWVADAARVAPESLERVLRRSRGFVERGHLVMTTDRWVLTEAGVLFADGIAGELMQAV